MDGIEYFNTGFWTDIPSSYVIIDNNGNIEMKEYEDTLELISFSDIIPAI